MYLEISIRHFVIVQRRYTDTVTCTSSIIHLNHFYSTHYLFSRLKRKKKGMGYDVTMYSAHLFTLIYGNTTLFDMSEPVSDGRDSFFPINLTTCTLFPN